MPGTENRQPYQVLVLPYTFEADGTVKYGLFKRADENYWQGIAGGGEGSETPLETAKREAHEEAGITSQSFITLLSQCSMPAKDAAGFLWGEDVFIVPEYAFGVEAHSKEEIKLSREHLECAWLSYEEAEKRLKWDSNKTALWELNYRLLKGLKNPAKNLELIQNFSCGLYKN